MRRLGIIVAIAIATAALGLFWADAGKPAAKEQGGLAASNISVQDKVEAVHKGAPEQGVKEDKFSVGSWDTIDRTGLKKAPEFAGITGYFNAPDGLQLSDLKGKVVLVDFWTYTCGNCVNTMPHVVGWNEKYSDKGLVIVGVHTPEFDFEKNSGNVAKAIEKFGIKYPVLQDNDYKTWSAYGNHYWPRFYLVDSEGYIRYDHIGEGNYDGTEAMIRQLLSEL